MVVAVVVVAVCVGGRVGGWVGGWDYSGLVMSGSGHFTDDGVFIRSGKWCLGLRHGQMMMMTNNVGQAEKHQSGDDDDDDADDDDYDAWEQGLYILL